MVRTAGQISTARDQELTSGTGLIGRWGMSEGTGTVVGNSISGGVNGTATNGPTWVAGFVPPAAGNSAPNAPTLNAPGNGATGVVTSPSLNVGVSDPNPSDPLTVTFFGRPWPVATSPRSGRTRGSHPAPTPRPPGPTWARARPSSGTPPSVTEPDHHRPDLDLPHRRQHRPGLRRRRRHRRLRANPGRRHRALIAGIDGTVWTAGDNVYPTGTDINNYNTCYEPAWGGAIKARTRPVPGNHDWGTGQVPSGSETLAAYFAYYGANANAGGTSYYSYNIPSSNWHVVNLDSECQLVPGGCAAGSAQELWLRADLAANATKNVIAVWHKPRFSSGVTNYTALQAFYDDIYEFGVDILLEGHDHIYERLAPMNSAGVADPTYGIRQFTVGTGGAALQSYSPVLATSQAGSGSTYGVLKLTLHATGYDWAFLPIAGQTFTDSGSGLVHAAPPAATRRRMRRP